MIPIKLTDAALARAMVQEEKDRQQEVLTGRMLHEGSVGATLTDRLKQYVVPPELTLNICKPVVTAVVDRLKVNDWEAVPMIDATGKSNADPADETAKEAHALAGDWAWSMWTRLGLNVASNNAHLWTVRGQIELQLGLRQHLPVLRQGQRQRIELLTRPLSLDRAGGGGGDAAVALVQLALEGL